MHEDFSLKLDILSFYSNQFLKIEISTMSDLLLKGIDELKISRFSDI